ncbi:hypothetical protein ACFR9U_02960 [Halorientalis brevis]|uniref:DUF8056 domain-containing protein n=1 Tax=Halorientalis brevis TaxID=1126241 RepID=A0ABD6C6N3_9EURY|nr:hypothetical protein [Halorientalis brevis]
MTEAASGETPNEERTADEDAYNGVLGAFPYAIRASESLLFKTYGVIGGLLAGLIAFLFTLSLVGIVANTTGTAGGVFSFSRAFVIFVGFVVVFPLIAPVLSVARRHRRTGSTPRYDAALGLAGYVFVLSLYLALLLSIPPEQQEPTSNAVVQLFYDLPGIYGLVPPTLAGLVLYLVHRRLT